MVAEFILTQDFKSPNAKLKNNKLVYKLFKRGDAFIGETTPVPKGQLAEEVYSNREGWMVPANKLQRKSKEKFKDFKHFDSEKNTVDTSEFPPEIQEKINQIANKNFSLNISKEINKNFSRPILFGVLGFGYAMFTGKNVYMWAIAGVIGGILINGIKKQPVEKAVEEAETKK